MIIQIIIVFLRFYFVIWTTHTRHNYSTILQTIIFLRKITYPYDLWNYFVMVLPNFIIIKSGYGHFKLRNHFSILLFWSFWIASFDFNYYFTRAIKYGRRGLIIRSSEIIPHRNRPFDEVYSQNVKPRCPRNPGRWTSTSFFSLLSKILLLIFPQWLIVSVFRLNDGDRAIRTITLSYL